MDQGHVPVYRYLIEVNLLGPHICPPTPLYWEDTDNLVRKQVIASNRRCKSILHIHSNIWNDWPKGYVGITLLTECSSTFHTFFRTRYYLILVGTCSRTGSATLGVHLVSRTLYWTDITAHSSSGVGWDGVLTFHWCTVHKTAESTGI